MPLDAADRDSFARSFAETGGFATDGGGHDEAICEHMPNWQAGFVSLMKSLAKSRLPGRRPMALLPG
jgi:hypothetical protein